jgi:hypothetical protein
MLQQEAEASLRDIGVSSEALEHLSGPKNKTKPTKTSVRDELMSEGLSCDGCGVELQYDKQDSFGFIPKLKVVQYF